VNSTLDDGRARLVPDVAWLRAMPVDGHSSGGGQVTVSTALTSVGCGVPRGVSHASVCFCDEWPGLQAGRPSLSSKEHFRSGVAEAARQRDRPRVVAGAVRGEVGTAVDLFGHGEQIWLSMS